MFLTISDIRLIGLGMDAPDTMHQKILFLHQRRTEKANHSIQQKESGSKGQAVKGEVMNCLLYLVYTITLTTSLPVLAGIAGSIRNYD